MTLHSLANKKQSDVITERFAQHYADYLAQREVLVMHHQKHAVLATSNNGWQLKTCDAQIVKVSQDLIDALTPFGAKFKKHHSGFNHSSE